MVRIHGKALGLFVPALTALFIGGKRFQGLQALGDVIGHQESLQMCVQVESVAEPMPC